MTVPNSRTSVDPLRILLIEDDEGDRDLALEYLEGDRTYQYQTTWAKSLEEGLAKLDIESFDVIILDLVLPDSKGVTTVSKLCASSGETPVIVSSYFDEDALASKAIELGAQDYLEKNVMNSQRLGRIISRAIARAKRQAIALTQQRAEQELQQSSQQLDQSPSADLLSTKIEQLQADMQRLESIASSVIQAYENQQSVGDIRQQMVKTLSHECRSPATVILLATNILKSYSTSVEDRQYIAAIARIDEAVKQMMKLLDSAMSFQRVQTISKAAPAEVVDVEALCQAVIAQISAALTSSPRFLVQCKGDCRHVCTYSAVVEQILLQLLTNAAQYSAPPEPVNVTIQNNGSNLLMTVEDHGRGILDDEQSLIFDAFYRSHRVEDTHGIGLGLAIVKTCVEICGGYIDVRSQLEQGTTVIVSLPIALSDGGISHQ